MMKIVTVMRYTVLLMIRFALAAEHGDPNTIDERPPNFNISYTTEYDKTMPPKGEDEPAEAHALICPWKIGAISFRRMTIEIDVYVNIMWEDRRLNIIPRLQNNTVVSLRENEVKMLWMPVLTFRNGMSDDPINTPKNTGIMGVKWNGGDFVLVARRTDFFHCNFKLQDYPMDTQHCRIEIQATNYKSALHLEPMGCPVDGLMGGSDPPEFYVFDFQFGTCTRKDKLSTFFSCVEYSFRLRRLTTRHVLFTYLPSLLIVILTFLSFWLECDNAAPRVALSLTSLLTLTTQFAAVQKELPPVAYVKAIDVWMFACIFTVFGGLIEFAFANYFDRVYPQRKTVPIKMPNVITKVKSAAHPCPVPIVSPSEVKQKEDNVIDRVSRKAFPAAFLLFNIVYWSTYA